MRTLGPMSADDEKRRRSKRQSQRPPEEEQPEGGAFFAAPTRAFQALPTEVLHVGSRSDERKRDGRSRATRLPSSSPPEPADLAGPPATEALGTAELKRLAKHEREAFPDFETEHLELTNPDPFRVDVDSVERALFEVARQPTHHDLYFDQADEPASDTSTDTEVPKPVSGVHQRVAHESARDFEDRTVGLGSESPTAHAPHLFEATDEDAALLSEPDLPELPLAAPVPDSDDEAAKDRYYEELRDVIGAARVFDPKRPVDLVTDPGVREHSDDEWPEITLDPAPLPRDPSEKRFPVRLALFLLAVLVVTVGGVGIGFALSRQGVRLDAVMVASGLVDKEVASGDGASSDDERAADDGTPATRAPSDRTAKQGAKGRRVDGWKQRTVQVRFVNVDDASNAGVSGLDDTLLKAFTSALAADEHALWQVVSEEPEGGYHFGVSLAVVSVDEVQGGASRARCALNAERGHAPKGRVEHAVSAERQPAGSLANADDDKLALEAVRACGFALALGFFERALR